MLEEQTRRDGKRGGGYLDGSDSAQPAAVTPRGHLSSGHSWTASEMRLQPHLGRLERHREGAQGAFSIPVWDWEGGLKAL